MKANLYNLIIILSSIIILLELLLNKTLIFDTISYSLNIWVTSIVPSLFPFFVLSDILISYNITNYIPKMIKKTFQSLFHVSENTITIFFLSILSGFPSNARNARKLYDLGLIEEEEASHALIFTHFSNPLFVLGTVSVFFLKNEQLGIILLISHYLSNIIVGLFLRRKNYQPLNHYTIPAKKSQNFPMVFANSIKSAIDTLLLILGTLTCFLVLSSIIINRLHLNPYNATLLKGILEMTMGLKSLSLLPISDLYKVVISTMFISFGGLSVHMQVISQLNGTKISYKSFLIGRIYQTILSGLIAYLLYIQFYL